MKRMLKLASKNAKIWKALKDFLELYPDLPSVYYGGQSFDPPHSGIVSQPYLIIDDVRFDGLRRYQDTLSKNWHTGNLAINVMTPLEWSDLQHSEYSGDIADYFTQDAKMTFDGVTLSVSREPTPEGAGYRDLDMWRQVILVPWEGMV